MPLRDLFCILEATEQPSTLALDQTLALARGHSAHADVLVAGPKIVTPHTLFNVSMVGGLTQAENEKTRARAEAIAAQARDAMAKAGVAGDVSLCLEYFQGVLMESRGRALCSDLTVLGRPGGVIERSQVLFEELLFGAGRPVMLATPDSAPMEKPRKIALAWDGSSHAARALGCALGLFADLKEADVIVVTGDKDLSESVPAAQVAAHIGRHGIKAKLVELAAGDKDAATVIDTHAAGAGCDLIVMGGFGRSRLREFVLGGVTRQLTQTARLPLLLAH